MGFIKEVDYRTGRVVFSCEINREGCVHTGCRAHRCPYGYCQRYYVCPSCWSKPEVKALFTKRGGHHERCKVEHELYQKQKQKEQTMLDSGAQLRCAALWHEVGGIPRTKVIFRDKDGEETAYWMACETYDAIPLLVPATPADYAKHGEIVQTWDTNIYSTK